MYVYLFQCIAKCREAVPREQIAHATMDRIMLTIRRQRRLDLAIPGTDRSSPTIDGVACVPGCWGGWRHPKRKGNPGRRPM